MCIKNSTKSAQKTNIYFLKGFFSPTPLSEINENKNKQIYLIEMIQYISKMLCVCIRLKSKFSWNTYCHHLHDHYGYQLRGGGIEVEVTDNAYFVTTNKGNTPFIAPVHLAIVKKNKKNGISLGGHGVFFTSSIILVAAILMLSIRPKKNSKCKS